MGCIARSDRLTGVDRIDTTIAALTSQHHTLDGLPESLPRTSGLYAWWGRPDVLPHLVEPAHPHVDELRLLYIGTATNLRTRITQNHLRRTGSSTLRRTLAGLLMTSESYRTRWTSRVVLIDEDEVRSPHGCTNTWRSRDTSIPRLERTSRRSSRDCDRCSTSIMQRGRCGTSSRAPEPPTTRARSQPDT